MSETSDNNAGEDGYGQPLRTATDGRRSIAETGAPLAAAEGTHAAPTKKRGDFFLPFTVTVGVAAVLLESTAHILGMFYADPLPHFGYLAAYALAVLAPLYVGAVVKNPAATPARRSIAWGLNAVSLLMAGCMSIALLPIAPFAVMLTLAAGFGLLGLSPYFLLILSIRQALQLREAGRAPSIVPLPRSAIWGTVATVTATGLVLFVQPILSGVFLADAMRTVPHTLSAARERVAADRLRAVGGENAVLILCYRTQLPLWEGIGLVIGGGMDQQGMRDSWFRWDGDLRTDDISVKQARRLYFLMTGQSYAQATPPWTISNRRPEQWIDDIASEDVGGIRVGRLAPGISLADKTGSAVLDPQTATGTTDMTLTFANATNTANEARAEVLLPPGAVCHQASLWINGTERPAAFGPQATVRRAYQAVAVVEQRDPLLVTMPVPGKLLVQCFPIPARGTMKIRLGVTFPLLPDVSDRRKLSYALPAWGAVNFAGAGKLADGWRVTDAATGKTPVLPLLLAPGAKWSEKATARRPINLIVALDGSIGMKEAFSRTVQSALQDYFDAVSSSSSMSYTGNADVPESFDTSMILVSHIAELLDFRDGQDNVPMLTRTMKARRRTIAEDSMETVVLYLHAGTPDAVSDAAPLAEAVKTLPPLASGRPRFVSLLLKPDAPDTIGDRLALQANARAISSALYPSAADAVTATVDAIVRGSDFPVLATTDPSLSAKRLAAYRDALAVWYVYNNFGAEALAAARIAAGMRLVTPLSGAVVLETRTDYEKHGLDDGTEKDAKRDADTEKKQVTKLVTPEPGTWALFAAGAATGLTALRLRRPRK